MAMGSIDGEGDAAEVEDDTEVVVGANEVVAGAATAEVSSAAPVERSTVGRGVSTAHFWPERVSRTLAVIRTGPVCVGMVISTRRWPDSPVTSSLRVNPVIATGTRGRAAANDPPGLSAV
ncbi:hypothetical protein G352_22396 [Rhodococcus ruber BKS 20-38]|uniref:Uncharacterized protein n=1 Tax=Rhodococcus ruber BKS 20-38 TaxID=1278076 RepID=M2X4P6_9NOCA|nr:hypothetical protein G352_22396 [Rhodococcus ruber BKS 20-38]